MLLLNHEIFQQTNTNSNINKTTLKSNIAKSNHSHTHRLQYEFHCSFAHGWENVTSFESPTHTPTHYTTHTQCPRECSAFVNDTLERWYVDAKWQNKWETTGFVCIASADLGLQMQLPPVSLWAFLFQPPLSRALLFGDVCCICIRVLINFVV